jgi:hypothetical protein
VVIGLGCLVSEVLGFTARLTVSHPLEAIITILDIVREPDDRELPIEDRDDYHIGLPAHGLTEMVFRVKVAVHPSTAMVVNDDRTQSRVRLRSRRLIDADGDIGGDLLVT